MDRVFKSGASGSPPVHTDNVSSGYATGGNPGIGVPATKPGPYWFHMITEEILNVITSAGLTPDKAAVNQLQSALTTLFGGSVAGADEPHSTVSISSNVLTLNLNSARVFKVSFNANITTTTINNPPNAAKLGSFVVILTADGTLRTWAWATSTVKWDGGIAPTFISTNNKKMMFLFWTDDGGTTWYGQVLHMNL